MRDHMHRKRNRPDDWEELDPSPVIHIRDLPEHTLEIDLIKTFERFGAVKDVSMIPNKGQALLEFYDIHSAEDVVNERADSILVANRRVKVNYSTSTRIEHRSRGNHSDRDSSGENNVLLFTIYNAIYPINVDVVKTICSPHGKILRIVIFRKNQVQAMVEFGSVDDARSAKKHLNGADIYSGCCTLKVEYARPTTLTVYKNDQDSWDFTGSLDRRPDSGSNSLLGLPEPSRSGVTLIPGAPSFDSHERGDRSRSRSDFDPRDERSSRGEPYSSRGAVPYSVSAMSMMPPGMLDPWRGGPSSMAMPGSAPLPSNTLLGAMMGGPQFSNSAGAGNGDLGGVGCVAIVYGFNMEKINCDRVFNVFCLYGNVIRVKFLHSKPGAALVQMGDPASIDKVINNLHGALLFGNKLEVQLSKQPNLKEIGQSYNLPDGSQSFKDFSSSRNQRFSTPEAAAKNRLSSPTSTLHYWNCPPDYNDDDMKKLISESGAIEPIQIQVFTARERSSSGLIEFRSKWDALDTLALINHTSIHHNDASRYPYLLKLCFSSSPIDGPGGEKKRSFPMSGRHRDSDEDGEDGVHQIKTISGFRGQPGRRGRR